MIGEEIKEDMSGEKPENQAKMNAGGNAEADLGKVTGTAQAVEEVTAEKKTAGRTLEESFETGTKDSPKKKVIKIRRKRSYKGAVVLAVLLALLMTAYYYFDSHTIVSVNISGNQVVSEDTVRDAVLASAPLNNTLLLKLNTRFHPVESIPFVAKLDIDIEGKDTVNVTVYEKSLSGCVEYMNGYVFFDKDGIVLEAGNHLIQGVPCIKGLKFDNWEMGERLPVSDTARFQYILSITQLVEKYKIDLDGIKFTPEDEIELTCGGVTVELGHGDYISIQLMNLGSILDQLKDMQGTLYMKDFKTSGSTASFSRK